jgi:hypothetical protein
MAVYNLIFIVSPYCQTCQIKLYLANDVFMFLMQINVLVHILKHIITPMRSKNASCRAAGIAQVA